jgi:hypothetical protein
MNHRDTEAQSGESKPRIAGLHGYELRFTSRSRTSASQSAWRCNLRAGICRSQYHLISLNIT